MSDTSYAGTDNPTDIAEYIQNLLKAHADELEMPEEDIYYGDQDLIPRTPTVCVESGPMESELQGAPMMLWHNFTDYIMIYHARVGDQQVTKKECEQFTNKVRAILHSDTQLNGLAIYSMVTRIDPGYANRANQMMRTTRITWEAKSKTHFVGG